jgi:hypothetical protein
MCARREKESAAMTRISSLGRRDAGQEWPKPLRLNPEQGQVLERRSWPPEQILTLFQVDPRDLEELLEDHKPIQQTFPPETPQGGEHR